MKKQVTAMKYKQARNSKPRKEREEPVPLMYLQVSRNGATPGQNTTPREFLLNYLSNGNKRLDGLLEAAGEQYFRNPFVIVSRDEMIEAKYRARARKTENAEYYPIVQCRISKKGVIRGYANLNHRIARHRDYRLRAERIQRPTDLEEERRIIQE